MKIIGQMKGREEELEKTNKSYGKVLIGILDSFKRI